MYEVCTTTQRMQTVLQRLQFYLLQNIIFPCVYILNSLVSLQGFFQNVKSQEIQTIEGAYNINNPTPQNSGFLY